MSPGKAARGGFTVIELLVVIGIILLLISLFAVTFGNTILTARERATQGTILKIDGLLQQRIESFHRAVDKVLEQGTNNQRYFRQVKADLGISNQNTSSYVPAMKVLTRKMLFKQVFPQSFDISEMPTTHPLLTSSAYIVANHKKETESAACLYYALTQAQVFGMAPVSSDNFSSNEVRDTDGDGHLEFIDAWGEPLRFYRWPTGLIRNTTSGTTISPALPGTSLTYANNTIDRQYALVLIPDLPAADGTNLDPLGVDPDDGYGRIQSMLLGLSQSDVNFRSRYHQLDTFFAPLIVSGGPGKAIGLEEPHTTNGRLGLPASRDDLLDDISNYNNRR
ncbi:MAG: hypothetical protein C0478_09670 [Planctomyces sp.]|nr:hypothetical protein [Planctomyces sp.]